MLLYGRMPFENDFFSGGTKPAAFFSSASWRMTLMRSSTACGSVWMCTASREPPSAMGSAS